MANPSLRSSRMFSAVLLLGAVFAQLGTVGGAPTRRPAEHGLWDDGPVAFVTENQDAIKFSSSFSASIVMILATEMGDKTFFIAAIMAMKHSRLQVLVGALSALFLMTVLSAAMGKTFPLLFDKAHTTTAAAILFTYFGVQLLWDYWKQRNAAQSESEELHEVENSLQLETSPASLDEKIPKNATSTPDKPMSRCAAITDNIIRYFAERCVPETFLRAFTLTFLAEWGDRSQIATIALAAAKDVFGVTLGALVGHTICTSIAVLGGRMLAARISERLVNLVGGILFLVFAGITLTRGASIR